jgi:hypothetical protein
LSTNHPPVQHSSTPDGRSRVKAQRLLALGLFSLGCSSAPAFGQACFEAFGSITTSYGGARIVAADVNSDGLDDMVVNNIYSNDLFIFLSLGGGQFSAPTSFHFASNPHEVEAADLDGDGDLDLSVATDLGIGILRNLGGGLFSAPVIIPNVIGASSIASADVDGDGDLDLVVAMGVGSSVRIFLNDGTGSFSFLASYYLTASFTYQVRCADLDADGKPDIVTVNNGQNTTSVLLNQGNGVFSQPVQYPVGMEPHRVMVADFDGNGSLDLAFMNVNGNSVSVLRNLGNGTFAPKIDYPSLPNSFSAVAMDWDADGDTDVVLLCGLNSFTFVVLPNQGNGTLGSPILFDLGPMGGSPAWLDLDQDGDLDLAALLANHVLLIRNCATIGSVVCSGDGSGLPCPCGNDASPGTPGGCLNSFGVAGELEATGFPSLSSDSVHLHATSLPNSPALFFQGTHNVAGVLAGDGVRCVTGSLIRLGQASAVNNEVRFPFAGQTSLSAQGAITTPGVRYYQVWYRNAASFCTPSTFNWTNALALNWIP